MGLLADTAEWFKSRGGSVSWLEDPKTGKAYGFVTSAKDTAGVRAGLYVGARKRTHGGRVSVMRRLVLQARDGDKGDYQYLLIRIGDRFRVYDPETVLEVATEDSPTEGSRDARGEEWIEWADKTYGADLRDALEGHDTPMEPEELNAPKGQATLTDAYQ